MKRSVGGARALALAAACALGAAAGARAQAATRLWVVRPPDALVEYDVASFTARRTLAVPRYVTGAPEYLSINAAGQVLFRPPRGLLWAGGEMAPASGRMWLWDGTRAQEARISTTVTIPGRTSRSRLEVATEWWLPARGDSLYRFESRFQTTLDSAGVEQVTRHSAGVGRGGLPPGGRADSVVTAPALPECACTTGVCEESCPEWSFWAPAGGVGDLFLLTRWIPGQLGATFDETVAYRRVGGRWTRSTLPEATESPRAASADGSLIVTARLDGGCCGWVNESSDQLVLVRGGASTVVYDERTRFGNADYDVSFVPTDAALAPGDGLVAYTLAGDVSRDSGRIRLSDSGKPNPAALAGIERELARMPAVDVVDIRGPAPRRLATIPRAALVGWLSQQKLLLAQGGHLVVYDITGGALQSTGIPVRGAQDAFLR